VSDSPPPSGDIELSATEVAELAEALVSAYAPAELDPRVNERLIRAAIQDPLAPPSSEELVESERLRRALDGDGTHPDMNLIGSLARAHGIAGADNVDAAVDNATRGALSRRAGQRHGNLIYVSFGVVVAAAAAVVLLVPGLEHPASERQERSTSPSPATAKLEASRSSEALFSERFERGRTSERIDRIASARARELRQNRFRSWGVDP
jgi:hypothetical protein